ncbi:hypothetical protein ILUMI_23975, partial [Ignelater luminosus]
MAQYYQVLSQADKNTIEELRQYYPNIVENQNIQYVIHSEDQTQQFQGQPILLSSEQVMVIENSGQQVVVDQPGTYQNSQYMLQDNTVDYQDPRTQQVYYMEEVDKDRQVHIEQQSQPIVLNHQLQHTQIRNQLVVNNTQKGTMAVQVRQQQIHQLQQQSQPVQTKSPVRQMLQPRTTTQVQQGQSHMIQQRTSVPQAPRQTAQVQQQAQITQQSHVHQQVQHQTTLQLPLQQ